MSPRGFRRGLGESSGLMGMFGGGARRHHGHITAVTTPLSSD